MDIPMHAALLSSIDAFLERHPHIGEARFGRDATGEPGLVERLRKGSSPTLRLVEKMRAYMESVDASVTAEVSATGDAQSVGSVA